MTAAETLAEPDATEGAAPLETGSDTVARAHAVVSLFFLLLGAVTYLATAAKLVDPGFLDGSAALSFGRLLPVSFASLLYGWLALMGIAAAYYMVPRVVGAPLAVPRVALGNLLLIAGGVAAGVVAVATGGQNAGGRYLELPLWSDIIVGVGLVVAAIVATLTAASGDRERLPVSAWYLVGGVWWYAIGYLVGAVPGVDGLGGSLQAWFAVSLLGGLAPAASGIGIGYYLLGRISGELHPRLGAIGFWSLAFTWLWTAPRYLQYGPTEDWLETVPVVFAAGMVVAIVTVVADMAYGMRGRWDLARRTVPLPFFLVGFVFLTLVPVLVLVQSFRGASAVVHLTSWETAFEQLTILGAFSFMAMAGAYHMLGIGRFWRRRLGGLHLMIAVFGLALSLISRWIGGLQSGYTWVAGVNSDGFENYSEGFRNTVVPLDGLNILQMWGLIIFVVSLVFFVGGLLANAVGERGEREGAMPPIDEATPTQPLRVIVQGAFLIPLVVALVVFVVPAIEAGTDASLLADTSPARARGDAQLEAGYDLYVSEGCWYCHTQQVRAIVTDVGLGPVSVAGDYAYDDADLLGFERIGPDLSHAGSRQPTNSQRLVRAHLIDPRDPPGEDVDVIRRTWSNMPSYDYLADEDLRALAAYVTGLE